MTKESGDVLAQTRVLGLTAKVREVHQISSPVEGCPTVRLAGPKIQTLLNSSIHGSRLQIETGDKILVLDEPTRLKLIEKRRQALIGRVEAWKPGTRMAAASCPTLEKGWRCRYPPTTGLIRPSAPSHRPWDGRTKEFFGLSH